MCFDGVGGCSGDIYIGGCNGGVVEVVVGFDEVPLFCDFLGKISVRFWFLGEDARECYVMPETGVGGRFGGWCNGENKW